MKPVMVRHQESPEQGTDVTNSSRHVMQSMFVCMLPLALFLGVPHRCHVTLNDEVHGNDIRTGT